MNSIIDVSISCTTYNHSKFLEKCLDSILKQVTNLIYEVVIYDDASIDGTKEIIEKYVQKFPDIVKPYYQKNNQYSKGVRGIMAKYNLPRCKGKYIALCEGDDYWTDPYKLQKQVDFLEANPNYSICWTKYKVKKYLYNTAVIENPSWIDESVETSNVEIDLHSIFRPYCTYTLTTMFKKSCLDLPVLQTMKYSKDNSLYALCLSKGNGMILDFYSGVYRMHDGGVYSNTSSYNQNYSSYLNLKEIVQVVPHCDNSNLTSIRNHHLVEAVKLNDKHFSRTYLELLIDSFKFLGIKKSIKLATSNLQ